MLARQCAAALLAVALNLASVQAADRVTVGTVGNSSDAGFFIAMDQGYFAAEGLDVALTPFDGAQRMMAPLGQGELDVGGGTATASLYNSASRGIGIRIVADRSRMEAGYMFQTLMVRKAVMESGRFRGYADLKGLKFALVAPGGSPGSALNEAAIKGGVPYDSIEKVFLPFPAQVSAYANGAIDASLMIEPFATYLVDQGVAVRFASSEDFYPGNQIGLVFFSEKFIKERASVGERFLRAYVRALRDYNDAVNEGRFSTGPKGDAIIAIMARNLGMKAEQIRGSYVQAISPDGKPNVESLRKDLRFFIAQGDVTDPKVDLDKILELSLLDKVVRDLGPYSPRKDPAR